MPLAQSGGGAWIRRIRSFSGHEAGWFVQPVLEESMVVSSSSKGEFLGHPKGLYVLFFTEMWERFSYYGMRALLVLYMVNYFKWTQESASSIYKWYTSLVYLTPLLGGYLADRYLGNKRAIIIGASLMAIGHFCMAFEQIEIFYAALVFLIVGNGFFKPNMSTQVGRLYPANDPRRDSAYTIFYMGINLGAFLSPLICGWLRLNTRWEYHAGFAAAGIGMVLGLILYLVGLRWVEEIPEGVTYQGDKANSRQGGSPESDHYMTEEEAATTPSVFPFIAKSAPAILALLAVGCVLAAPVLVMFGYIKTDNAVALAMGGGFSCAMGAWIVSKLQMAVRDRVLAIYFVAVFVVFFWSAFEQAGNAMNVFADKTTQRYITEPAPTPPIYPDRSAAKDKTTSDWQANLSELIRVGLDPTTEGWFSSARPIVAAVSVILMIFVCTYFPRRGSDLTGLGKFYICVFVGLCGLALLTFPPTVNGLRSAFNPMSTEWFQSINALAIFTLAPVFAWMWLYLPQHGIKLSIPAKVTIGVFLQAVAFMLMWWAIQYENQPSSAPLAQLPPGIALREGGQVAFRDAPNLDDKKGFDTFGAPLQPDHLHVVNGGRIYFDAEAGKLNMKGVLADTDRDRLLRATVPVDYLTTVRDLAQRTARASKDKKDRKDAFTVEVDLPRPPAGFDMRYADVSEKKVHYDAARGKLVATAELADKDYKSLLVAGADPTVRDAMNKLYVESTAFRVSSWWLFWFYILCTLGELCLSPVGLSMVSKLAPAKFATMLMGMWLLTSFFGNFFAGFAGESYGTIHPAEYFVLIAAVVGGASLICWLTVKKTKAMMHGVN